MDSRSRSKIEELTKEKYELNRNIIFLRENEKEQAKSLMGKISLLEKVEKERQEDIQNDKNNEIRAETELKAEIKALRVRVGDLKEKVVFLGAYKRNAEAKFKENLSGVKDKWVDREGQLKSEIILVKNAKDKLEEDVVSLRENIDARNQEFDIAKEEWQQKESQLKSKIDFLKMMESKLWDEIEVLKEEGFGLNQQITVLKEANEERIWDLTEDINSLENSENQLKIAISNMRQKNDGTESKFKSEIAYLSGNEVKLNKELDYLKKLNHDLESQLRRVMIDLGQDRPETSELVDEVNFLKKNRLNQRTGLKDSKSGAALNIMDKEQSKIGIKNHDEDENIYLRAFEDKAGEKLIGTERIENDINRFLIDNNKGKSLADGDVGSNRTKGGEILPSEDALIRNKLETLIDEALLSIDGL